MENTYFLIPDEEYKNQFMFECWKKEIFIPEKNFVPIEHFNEFKKGNRIIFAKYDSNIKLLKEIAVKNNDNYGENINITGIKNFYVPDEIQKEVYFDELKEVLEKKNTKYINEIKKNGKIVLFYTPKGGVGKTQISQIVSEVSHLLLKPNIKILFVDANYAEGSYSERFNEYDYSHSLDLVINEYENGGDILPVLKKAIVSEPEFAYEYSKGYKLKNIDVLFSPLNDSIGINKIFVNKGLFSNIFENLKNIYDLIFIDTSNESMLCIH